jgi:hypothetical protein
MNATKYAIFSAALVLLTLVSANAQTSKYRGNYYFGVVYTVGEAAGLGSHGGGTVARNGRTVFTEYFPSTGESYTATAQVNRVGRIRFTEDYLAGGGRIYVSGRKRLGNGTFGNPFSGGSFFLVK